MQQKGSEKIKKIKKTVKRELRNAQKIPKGSIKSKKDFRRIFKRVKNYSTGFDKTLEMVSLESE